MDIEQLKYPLGKPSFLLEYSEAQIKEWIEAIRAFPEQLSKALDGLSPDQHEWIYRPDGWNIREVVHHCADSHSMALLRFKKALSEDKPDIMGYEEGLFAQLSDYEMGIESSVDLLKGLHIRWAHLLQNMGKEDFERTYYHSAMKSEWKLGKVLQLYAWHCKHHVAHIYQAVENEGKF